MSDEKFTLGEWRAKGNSVRWKERDPLCPDNLFNGLICKCVAPDNVPESKKEVTANVHLIAAAPEMYRMLVQLHGALQSVPVLQKEIEKVLRKARGEK